MKTNLTTPNGAVTKPEYLDGLSVLEEMQLNPGVLYTRVAYKHTVFSFDTERYVSACKSPGDIFAFETGAAFSSADILAKDWYEYRTEETTMAALRRRYNSAATDPSEGPEFARGVLAAISEIESRGDQ